MVPDPDRVIDTVGAVVSTRCDRLAAMVRCVRVALFDAVSRMVALVTESVFAVTVIPFVSLSPDTTVYEKTSAVEPEPLAYEADLLVDPITTGIVGVPVTFTASEKLTVT